MCTYCGAKCEECGFKADCRGCRETCGKPFGGNCIAAEYIKFGGLESYKLMKEKLLNEINELLEANDMPKAEALHELPGSYVNLSYPLPNGQNASFLDNSKIYLCTQIEFANLGICYGVVADTTFILVCTYGVNGSEPELRIYKKR